jgi:TM2 domain-containing membrane protein YozV
MQIMKYFYKIFAVLSLFIAILGIFTLNIFLILLCGGAAWYLWRLSQEEQISKDGIPKPADEPQMSGKQLKNEINEICSNSDVNTESPSTPKKIRNPLLAVIFSFFFCGWGQWYNGKTKQGLTFFGAALIIIILMFIFINFGLSLRDLVVPISFFVLLAVWVYGMADAKEISEKINNGEESFSRKSHLFWFPTLLIVSILIIFILIIISAVFVAIYYPESTSPYMGNPVLPGPLPRYVPWPNVPNPVVHPPQYIPPQYIRPPQYIPPPHI